MIRRAAALIHGGGYFGALSATAVWRDCRYSTARLAPPALAFEGSPGSSHHVKAVLSSRPVGLFEELESLVEPIDIFTEDLLPWLAKKRTHSRVVSERQDFSGEPSRVLQ